MTEIQSQHSQHPRPGGQHPRPGGQLPPRYKSPLPAVIDVGTFLRRFGSDEECWEHLKISRWGAGLERYACPDCGHAKGWWLANRKLVECADCHHQTSVTADTVFHRARVPLWKWFWAIYQLAQDKKGIAALTLAKQIDVCYGTAWLMLSKLRRAMRHGNERSVLQGLVEVDETYIGGEEPGHRGRPARDSEKKFPVAVALELDAEGKPQRVAMASLEGVTGHHLKRFASSTVAQLFENTWSKLRTDGWGGAYRTVARAGYEHDAIVTGGGREAVQTFPWIHTFIGNMKRMILGTHPLGADPPPLGLSKTRRRLPG